MHQRASSSKSPSAPSRYSRPLTTSSAWHALGGWSVRPTISIVEVDACAEASERALVHARQAGDRFEEREIVEWLVIALLLGPAPANQAYRRCVELLEAEWGDPLLCAEVEGAAGALLAMLDRRPEADALLERARETMRDADEWIWIVSFWRSFTNLWYGDPGAAEEELRPAYEALERIGERSHFSSIAHALASALYAQGRYEEADEYTRECERASRPNDVHSQVLWRSIRAKVRAQRGEFEEAERLSSEAVEYGVASDFLHAYADALCDRAEVLELAGEMHDERGTHSSRPSASRSRKETSSEPGRLVRDWRVWASATSRPRAVRRSRRPPRPGRRRV